MGKPNRPDYTILTLTDVRALNSVISRFSRHTEPIAGHLTRHYNFWIITVFPKMLPKSRNWAQHLSLAIKRWICHCLLFQRVIKASKRNINALGRVTPNLTLKVRPNAN